MFDEEAYLIFILGYDLLHDRLYNNHIECDTAYNWCRCLVQEFMQSDEYKTMQCSTYDALQQWLVTYEKEEELRF